ncbi:MAG: zf-HC2 domain-containing protein [Fimbriimonadales bacterium]
MNCDKAQELFSELHEESLAEGLRIKVNRHLDDCPSCQHEFKVFQRNYALFSNFSPVPVPDDLIEVIARKLDRIDYEQKQVAPARSPGWLRFGAVGAAAAAFIAVAVFWKPDSNAVGAGMGGVSVTKPSDLRVEKVNDIIRLRYSAEKDTRIDVLEGGADPSTVPPVDAKQMRVDHVDAGSHYDVPVDVSGPIPQALWLRVSATGETVGVFFPQPAVRIMRDFEGNTLNALQSIANGFGVIVEAHISEPGKSRPHSLQGEDPIAAAKRSMKGTPYLTVTLKNGVLRVR